MPVIAVHLVDNVVKKFKKLDVISFDTFAHNLVLEVKDLHWVCIFHLIIYLLLVCSYLKYLFSPKFSFQYFFRALPGTIFRFGWIFKLSILKKYIYLFGPK